MNDAKVKEDFRKTVCEQIDLEKEGIDRYRVLTPFRFEDGDHFGIVMKKDASGWVLTDEAHTIMHLSYWLEDQEIDSGNRHEIIQGSLAAFAVENRNGELVLPIVDEGFGGALFNFVQALSKVSDVSFLSRERVRSTFIEDFRAFLESTVPPERRTFNWTDPTHDPKHHYSVDCRINGMPEPLLVYALSGETKIMNATINLLKFEQWGMHFRSLAIFEEQERFNPTTVARFTDVCEKTFSNLDGNIERIQAYLQRVVAGLRS